ncbi:hypothetical protein K402DRAFT_460060 [Aulographum hederae CBS 113979]|uniref:Uncharacterized protein n=1 Tax=Aulographum hederae CBS 113979 TaxID=1176131 RepID=A0A6G1HC66_9PEZI|nr:hypothetical protein K402DRAFT_460060 [Aulographum hederae CBS 113979]
MLRPTARLFSPPPPPPPPAYDPNTTDPLFTGDPQDLQPPSTSHSYQPLLQNPSPIPTPVPTRPSTSAPNPACSLSIPLTLTLDTTSIYPPPPSSALYHLPRSLTWSGNEIFLSLSLPSSLAAQSRGQPATRDLKLYTMRRTPFASEIALVPRRSGGLKGVMVGKKGLRGGVGWEVRRGQVDGLVEGEAVLWKYTRGKWKDSQGKVVASEGESVHEIEGEKIVREELNVGVELQGIAGLTDLLVACWCARLWRDGEKSFGVVRALMVRDR